jgi:hypothetical protein
VKRTTALLTCLLALLILAPTALQADTYMRAHMTNAEYVAMGDTIPASEMVTELWMGDQWARMEMDTAAVLIDLANDKMFILDHNQQEYVKLSIGSMNEIFESMGLDTADQQAAAAIAMMQNMMAGMSMTVTPTEESREVQGYNCTKYEVALDLKTTQVNSEVWATQDLKVDMPTYFKLTHSMIAMFPFFQEAMTEWQKIKGVPVLTVTDMQMQGTSTKTTTELLEVKQADPPPGTYKLPEDYKETEVNPMGG